MLNKLRCHAHFEFSDQITWSSLLIQIHTFNDKQCRSRPVGFFRIQLIWIYTGCKGRIYPGSAGQRLRIWNVKYLHNAEWLLKSALDHEVLGSNPAGGGTAHVCTAHHCTELFIVTLPSSGYDLHNVERDVICQTITIYIKCKRLKICILFICISQLNNLSLASLGGSVGCAVRLETRRSRVQPPPRSATFFRGDWSWNIFYGHSLPSADSRRAVVSFWRKNVHNTG